MKETINIGESVNDGTGDTLRSGAVKINQNFTELYNRTESMITGIYDGEGILVTQSFGQITITNNLPNRGSFNSVEVAGQQAIETSQLTDTLTLVAGQNIQLLTNPVSKSVTISVESLQDQVFDGDFTGSFTGDLTGNLNSSRVRILGNEEAAQSYYDSLISQQSILANQIIILQGSLESYQLQKQELLDDQAYWNSQPESSQKTAALLSISGQLISVQAQIDGATLELSNKETEQDLLTATINDFSPTLTTPYTDILYNAVNLNCSISRELDLPSLTVDNFTFDDTGILYSNLHTWAKPQTSTVLQSATSVIFSSVGANSQTLKLLVLAKCGGEVQSCEIIVSRSNSNVVTCSVYGIVYTGLASLCEFNAQWNSNTSQIDVLATNLSSTTTAYFTVKADELSSTN
jgi:hypothetical protein